MKTLVRTLCLTLAASTLATGMAFAAPKKMAAKHHHRARHHKMAKHHHKAGHHKMAKMAAKKAK